MSDAPLTGMNFDTSDRPSMGDPDFVEGRVRAMLIEANKVRQDYLASEEPNAHIIAQHAIEVLVDKWTAEFVAGNNLYTQTMTPEAQAAWLKQHGFGTEDDGDGPVKALVATTINQIIDADKALAAEVIDEEACRFRIEVAVEDCVAMLLGIENSAEG